jgi:trimeric autotransporter adhesin
VQEQQYGVSPLHIASEVSQQTAELVSLLIQSGADVNAATNDKVTPLMLARELSVVRLLLEAGAAVNAKCSDGTAVLHQAAKLGLSAAVICCLLKAGGDATAANSEGHNAAAVAVKHGHTATAALLQRAAGDQRTASPAAAAKAAKATIAPPPAAAAPAPAPAPAPTTEATAAATTLTAATSANTAANSRSATEGADAVTHAKHSAEAVLDSAVKPTAAATTAAPAAAAAAAATAAKATATWVCRSCMHIDNPMQDVACQACGVVGYTEQYRREFEAALPHLIARGPDITLPPSFFDDMPAKTNAAAAAPRSLHIGSSRGNKRGSSMSNSSTPSSLLEVEAMHSLHAPAPTAAATGALAAPARSEPAGGSWRCAERDLPVRNRYLSKIAQVLASSTKTRLCGSTRDNSSMPTAARHLEAQLYKSAAGFAVYSDDSTWQLRLSLIVESDVDGEAAVAWRATDPYCQQREQAAVAAIAAATITPTPLACISTELAGGSWRSDAHDMQQRRQFVNAIAQALSDLKKAPPAFVAETDQRLEASLYSSASEFLVYSDKSAWGPRLEQVIAADNKHREAVSARDCTTAAVVAAAAAARTLASGAAANSTATARPVIAAAAAVAGAPLAAAELATVADVDKDTTTAGPFRWSYCYQCSYYCRC